MRIQQFAKVQRNHLDKATQKFQIKHTPCELKGPGVLAGARLGLMGREGAEYSGTVGDWQGLVRGDELGEVPRPELEDGCRC